METTITIKKKQDDFGLEGINSNNNIVRMDTLNSFGGQNFGATPMELLLYALGGCSGLDVLSILKKQKQVIEDFQIEVKGSKEKQEFISLWKNVSITFQAKGNIDHNKFQHACDLSIQKYCSVAQTLRLSGCNISYQTKIIHT